MPTTSRSMTLGLIAAVALASPTAAMAKQQFLYTVAPGATVSVVNNYGTVRLRGSNSHEVVVVAQPASSQAQVSSAQNGNRIEVRTISAPNTAANEGSVAYDVQLPADSNVVIRTATGAVEVQGVNGDITVEADSGKVDVRDSSGHVHVRTVSAPLTLSNLKDGFVEATSVSGQLILNNVGGKLVTVNTTGGPITYKGDFAGGGQYSLSSHSGTIEVTLPASASLDVDARSVTGTVENDFPQKAPATLDQSKSFAGSPNAGASAVRLRTFSGKIRVKKQ